MRNDKNCKALIIGAGISGITAGRILAENGWSVTILEKRSHIGGNCYDYYENGILIHKYGPHLFHTRLPDVAEFVCRFSEFFDYEHRVLGEIDHKLVPIPFNFKSIDSLFPENEATALKTLLKEKYPEGNNVPIMELRRHPDKKVQDLAEFVFRKVFYGYSKKQWGKNPEELDPSVLGRVPVRMSYDDRYFNDSFQQMPAGGYTEMLRRMLSHENISIRLNCDGMEHLSLRDGRVWLDDEMFDGEVIYTGCIEALLGRELGSLPYRSLSFAIEERNVRQAQPVVQVNYPNRFRYTRISEFALVQQGKNVDRTALI